MIYASLVCCPPSSSTLPQPYIASWQLFSIALILLLKSVSGRLGLLPGFKSKSIERTTIIEQQLQTGRLSTQAETRTPEAVRAQRYIRRLYRLLVAYFTLLAGLVFFITACTVYIWANIAAVRAE